MKKRITLLLMVLMLLLSVLAACSSGNKSEASESWFSNSNTALDNSAADYYMEPEAPMDGVLEAAGTAVKSTSLAEKIIYTASADIETVDFEASVQSVYDMLDKYGAFLESSNISGKSYRSQVYNYQTYRYASFTIRVPVEAYKSMTSELDAVGNVLNISTGIQNITEQYYDSQSRLEAYEIEQERLLAMLEKAENVTDMLDIESRLSQVRYEIESLESTLRNWQNQVDYSTVNIYLSEVEELTETVETHRTYWQEIGDGFKSTLKSIGSFFKGLFKWFVVALPVLLIIAVIIAAVVLIIRVAVRRHRRKNNGDTEDQNEIIK
ncbi:MAG: DUF4349 domain-containing protein [Oscillospiraceae bacterium]